MIGSQRCFVKNAWVPKDEAGPPRQACKKCRKMQLPVVCEVLWDQPKEGKHIPDLCPKCIRLAMWCRGTLHKPDIAHRYSISSELVDPSLVWKPSEAGVEAETSYDGQRVLIQIRPWLFFVPKYREERYTATGQEEELLRGDRLPAGASEHKLLLVALQRVRIRRGRTAFEGDEDDGFHESQAAMGGKLYGKWRAYSFDGHRNDYGERHGVTYFKPKGWVKQRIKVDPDVWNLIQDWPIVWHGTTLQNAAKIVYTGLRQRGEGGAPKSHGQAGSSSNKSIYVSPALGLASHPVYSQFFKLGPGLWGQVVLQCKVRPGSWQVRRNTLGGYRHWPRDLRLDPNFQTNRELEFLCEDPSDIVVIGLMHRQFGPEADASIYGDLATQVRDVQSKEPQFHWTELLSQERRAQGLLVDLEQE